MKTSKENISFHLCYCGMVEVVQILVLNVGFMAFGHNLEENRVVGLIIKDNTYSTRYSVVMYW